MNEKTISSIGGFLTRFGPYLSLVAAVVAVVAFLPGDDDSSDLATDSGSFSEFDSGDGSSDQSGGDFSSGGSGGSVPAFPSPAVLPGRVSRRACAECGAEILATGCPATGASWCGAAGADRRAAGSACAVVAACPRPWNSVGSSSGAGPMIPAGASAASVWASAASV